jgi:hypothetical protein
MKCFYKVNCFEMKKITIAFLLSLIGFAGFAQENNKVNFIKGTVLDSDGNTPVIYTNIGIEGTYIGTASNAEGNFELKIPEDFVGKQIFFSAVGYKNKLIPVTLLIGKEFNLIKLEPQSYDIGDIDVNAQSKVLYRILRTASEDIPKNFVKGPFNMDCSFDYEKIADTLKLTMSAKTNIYDKNGYSKPSVEDAYKSRNYSFSNVVKNFGSYGFAEGITNLDEVLSLDLARSVSSILNPVNLDRFILNQEEDAELNGFDVWVIGFKQPKPDFEGSGDFYASLFEGKIYINKNNYKVIKIECWVKSDKQTRAGRGLAVGVSNKSYLKNVAYDYTVSYNSQGLDFISIHKNYEQANKPVSENSRLVVKKINTSNVEPIASKDYFVGE